MLSLFCSLTLFLLSSVATSSSSSSSSSGLKDSFPVLPIFSWNTLSVGDTFADGWGCMGEIARREELVAKGLINEDAERLLLSERFTRVAAELETAKKTSKVIAVQEADLTTVSGGEYLLKYFKPESNNFVFACQASSSEEMVFLIVDSRYVSVISSQSYNDLINGILGCAATVVTSDSKEKLTLLSMHLSASKIRNPATMNSTLSAFLNLLPPDGTVVAMGDFNTQLADLFDAIKDMDQQHSWLFYSASNTTNFTTNVVYNSNHHYQDGKSISDHKEDARYYFTTQHENNFIAAYDGYLIRDLNARLIPRTSVIVKEAGFMPKHVGDDLQTGSSFSYSDGAYPTVSGDLMFSSKFSTTNKYDKNNTIQSVTTVIDLGPQNVADVSLSDHLAVALDLEWH